MYKKIVACTNPSSITNDLPLLGRGCRVATGEVNKKAGAVSTWHSKAAFTLAEALITLAVIGVVAAITLPGLITNIQERIRTEQTRVVKYKLTNATGAMNALGLMYAYPTTMDFVDELKNHYKIIKTCDSSHLTECWPYRNIKLPDGTGTSSAGASSGSLADVTSLTNGTKLSALALGTASTATVGLVTGDGIPMLMVYSPMCQTPEDTAYQQWSMVNGKPETNATTNCLSVIFDINGASGPNKLGTDVRTLNSIFGFRRYPATYLTKAECEEEKNKGYGITQCYYETDYWAGAMKKCHDIGMHLPSLQTLANIAGAVYGRTDIGPKTSIMRDDYSNTSYTSTGNCRDYYQANGPYRLTEGNVICTKAGENIPIPTSSAVRSLTGGFWSSQEVSGSVAYTRNIGSTGSSWYRNNRNSYYHVPLCLGD